MVAILVRSARPGPARNSRSFPRCGVEAVVHLRGPTGHDDCAPQYLTFQALRGYRTAESTRVGAATSLFNERTSRFATMYEYNKSRIDELRRRFEEEVEARSRGVEATGREYLEALTSFVDEFNQGPGADPRLLGLDTTGQLDRTEHDVEWAEGERHRVRRIISGGF